MSRTFAILSLSTLLGVAPSGLFAKSLDSIRPEVMVPSLNLPLPGQTVTYTVTLSGTATDAGYLTISSSTLSNFSALPTTVSYNAGDSTVVFNGTIATTGLGVLQLTASNANGSISLLGLISVGAARSK